MVVATMGIPRRNVAGEQCSDTKNQSQESHRPSLKRHHLSQAIAHDWLRQGRTAFRMIYCTMEQQQEMTIGGLLEAIEDILQKPDAFAYPIEYVKPPR